MKPAPLATDPNSSCPYPKGRLTEKFACPGTISAGASTDRPARVACTTSATRIPFMTSFLSPRDLAVSCDMRIALSQVSFVMGSGHSCIQPLFAYRPSSTAPDWMKLNSREEMSSGTLFSIFERRPATELRFGVRGASVGVEAARKPSLTKSFQA